MKCSTPTTNILTFLHVAGPGTNCMTYLEKTKAYNYDSMNSLGLNGCHLN